MNDSLVHIVDDDPSVCKVLASMLSAANLRCAAYSSAAAFLAEPRPGCPSCLILDLQLAEMSGVDLLRKIKDRPEMSMPVIILTGVGSVSVAVQSMKLGVYDFLEKPVDLNLLLGDVQEALAIDVASRARATVGASVQRRIDLLTDRECEVLRLLCQGKSSRQMSTILNISVKTVAIHRWHMIKKMQAASATEAIHLAHQARAVDPSTLSESMMRIPGSASRLEQRRRCAAGKAVFS